MLPPSFKIRANPPLDAITFRAPGDVPPIVLPLMLLLTWMGVPLLITVAPSVSTPMKFPATTSLLLPTTTKVLLGLPARQSPLTVEPELSPGSPHVVPEQRCIT